MLNRRQAACSDTLDDLARVRATFQYLIRRLKGQHAHNEKINEKFLGVDKAMKELEDFMKAEQEDDRDDA